MKRKVLLIVGLPLLLISQAFACEPVSQNATEMRAAISKTSAPENVQAAASRSKAMYCHQNAVNLGLQGDAHANYMASCMNRNEALELKSSMSKGQQI